MAKMEKKSYFTLLDLLKSKTPFAFARFNDGEMKVIGNAKATIARGDQQGSPELQIKLRQALEHRQVNYWIGKPCGHCFSKQRKVYDGIVPSSYPYQTHAVIFSNNDHWQTFKSDFPAAVKQQDIQWIVGHTQDMAALAQQTGMDVSKVHHVPAKDSFAEYARLKNMWSTFKEGQVVVMTCGPISRVLAAAWFAHRPDCTFFDAGGLFDPFTKNVWYGCHKRTLKFCKECNYAMERK